MDAASYPFKTKPYVHQSATWMRSKDLPVFALFTDMGTGKSKMLIDTVAWLYLTGRIDAAVIVAPKGVYRNWADSELPAHMPDCVPYRVGVWSAEGRKADVDALAALFKPGPDLKVLLLNVEALGRDLDDNRAFRTLEGFLKGSRALVAVDESTTIKNPKATRTKAMLRIAPLAPYRRILSGQPAVNGPLDMYSPCQFLDWRLLGFSSFYAFKAHVAKLVPMRKYLGKNDQGEAVYRAFKVVKGYQNLDELNRKVTKFAAIIKKEDCLDLPPKVFQTRTVELGPKQRKAYDQMKRLAMVELGKTFELTSPDAMLDPATTSTASLVITQMLRLHQILCGFIVNDAKQPVVFDEPNPRLESLVDLLDECPGKVVIWATYKVTVRQIQERLAKEYGPDSVVTYYGDTSTEDRRAAIRDFQDPDSPVRFFISNRTGARGLTLTASHTAVYYSYDHDLDTHDQSQDRIHRIGQNTSCTYVYMTAPGTMEEKVRMALREKQDISKLITPSNWKDFL